MCSVGSVDEQQRRDRTAPACLSFSLSVGQVGRPLLPPARGAGAVGQLGGWRQGRYSCRLCHLVVLLVVLLLLLQRLLEPRRRCRGGKQGGLEVGGLLGEC